MWCDTTGAAGYLQNKTMWKCELARWLESCLDPPFLIHLSNGSFSYSHLKGSSFPFTATLYKPAVDGMWSPPFQSFKWWGHDAHSQALALFQNEQTLLPIFVSTIRARRILYHLKPKSEGVKIISQLHLSGEWPIGGTKATFCPFTFFDLWWTK